MSSNLVGQLRASVKYDAVDGDDMERGVVSRQLTEAADRIVAMTSDLRQANAVIDAIETLLENGRATMSIGKSEAMGLVMVVVNVKDDNREWSGNVIGASLRDALVECLIARDQHDKEGGA